MNSLPKFLVAAGSFLILIGLAIQFGGKYFHFGKLPGDIAIEKENFKFYFPIASSMLLSILLSAIMFLFRSCSK